MNGRERRIEISDEIVSFDPGTLERCVVERAAVVARLRAVGDERAARIVEGLPVLADGTTLDPAAVDRQLVRAHCEMQRVSEEFQHGPRVAALLRPLLDAIRGAGHVDGPLAVVDIGCGTGFVVRWLAACADLGPDVRLLGVDFNPALIAEATRLAEGEGLDCRFVVRNAFALDAPAAVYMSTGVLHHFPPDALPGFFGEHDQPGTFGFLHFDFQPSWLTPVGSWAFHALRMREPLARHDGVVSALRLHTGPELTAAARMGAPGFRSGIYGARLYGTPIRRVFHTLVGVRPEVAEQFTGGLGALARRMEPLA